MLQEQNTELSRNFFFRGMIPLKLVKTCEELIFRYLIQTQAQALTLTLTTSQTSHSHLLNN